MFVPGIAPARAALPWCRLPGPRPMLVLLQELGTAVTIMLVTIPSLLDYQGAIARWMLHNLLCVPLRRMLCTPVTRSPEQLGGSRANRCIQENNVSIFCVALLCVAFGFGVHEHRCTNVTCGGMVEYSIESISVYRNAWLCLESMRIAHRGVLLCPECLSGAKLLLDDLFS